MEDPDLRRLTRLNLGGWVLGENFGYARATEKLIVDLLLRTPIRHYGTALPMSSLYTQTHFLPIAFIAYENRHVLTFSGSAVYGMAA